MTSNLIISIPGKEPVLFELNAERIGLGRAPDNQIHVDVAEISSSHLEIEKKGDDYIVTDLDSFNGTRVNGEKISKPTTLKDQDRLLLGETVPAHFLKLAEGADPEEAVIEAGADAQKAAATYVSLDEKVRQLEASIAEKQKSHDQLQSTVESLKGAVDSLKEAGADPSQIETVEKDLLEKTQQVEVLKTDIAELEKTAKTTLSAPPAAPPVKIGGPLKPPGGGGGGGGPVKPPGIAPLKPPGAGVPPSAAPKKPPGAPQLPPAAAPKKPPGA